MNCITQRYNLIQNRIILLVLLLGSFNSYSNRHANIDSLTILYESEQNVSNKIKVGEEIVKYYSYNKSPEGLDYALQINKLGLKSNSTLDNYNASLILGQTYFDYNFPEKSIDYCQDAVSFAKKLRDTLLISRPLVLSVNAYIEITDYEKAKDIAKEILNLAKKIKNDSLISVANTNLGMTEYHLADYATAIEYFLTATEIYDDLGLEALKHSSYIMLSKTFAFTGNLDESFKYANKSYRYYIAQKDTLGIVNSLGELASISMQQKEMDQAKSHFETQLLLMESLPKDVEREAMVMGNLGLLYKNKKEYLKAKDMLQGVLENFSLTNNKRMVAISHINLSEIEFQLDNFIEAVGYAEQARDYALSSKEREILKLSYLVMYRSNFMLKKYKEALYNYRDFKTISDSILNTNTANKIAELQNQYLMKEKEKENELLKAQNEVKNIEIKKNQTLLYSLYAGGILLLLLVVISLRAYFIKQKDNKSLKTQNKLINEQKDAIRKQKMVVEEKNKEITDSINYAKRIQNAIIPPVKKVKTSLPYSFVFYRPKDIVSGDFYWRLEKDDKVLFAVADCTGHGVPGAMVSVVCNNSLNQSVKEFNLTDPAKILDKTRSLVLETFESKDKEVKDGMDIALCSMTIGGPNAYQQLEYAGANNPLWIVTNREDINYESIKLFDEQNDLWLHEIKANKQPVGEYHETRPFNTQKVQLVEGDTFYLFSDGYPDQFGGDSGKKLKYRPFKKLLLSIHHLNMIEQEKEIANHFDQWKGAHEQVDDVCVIGVRV